MRLVQIEQPKLPLSIKLFMGAIASMVFAALGGMLFIIFIIMSDPLDAGETFGGVAASIVNGFNHVLED